ncbi:hypothetical protein KM043_003365 [Ampulex compressa]|nr:hypothetical protein KM043_003365 [Ampulex compressa]
MLGGPSVNVQPPPLKARCTYPMEKCADARRRAASFQVPRASRSAKRPKCSLLSVRKALDRKRTGRGAGTKAERRLEGAKRAEVEEGERLILRSGERPEAAQAQAVGGGARDQLGASRIEMYLRREGRGILLGVASSRMPAGREARALRDVRAGGRARRRLRKKTVGDEGRVLGHAPPRGSRVEYRGEPLDSLASAAFGKEKRERGSRVEEGGLSSAFFRGSSHSKDQLGRTSLARSSEDGGRG